MKAVKAKIHLFHPFSVPQSKGHDHEVQTHQHNAAVYTASWFQSINPVQKMSGLCASQTF